MASKMAGADSSPYLLSFQNLVSPEPFQILVSSPVNRATDDHTSPILSKRVVLIALEQRLLFKVAQLVLQAA